MPEIKRISYSHDAMVDIIIANPCISQNQIAAHFGYTPSWVSQIIASDAFQARLAERRDEIVDPTIRATVEESLKGLLVRSMAILREKLDRPTHTIPDNLAIRTAELSAKALGYGARPELLHRPEAGGDLEKLGERLVNLLERKRAITIEGVPYEEAEVTSEGPAPTRIAEETDAPPAGVAGQPA
jgi:hypothetical protein